MLDLKLLESLVDKALESETPENMLAWLKEQEERDLENFSANKDVDIDQGNP